MTYEVFAPRREIRNGQPVVVAVDKSVGVYDAPNNDRAAEFAAMKELVEAKFGPLDDSEPTCKATQDRIKKLFGGEV